MISISVPRLAEDPFVEMIDALSGGLGKHLTVDQPVDRPVVAFPVAYAHTLHAFFLNQPHGYIARLNPVHNVQKHFPGTPVERKEQVQCILIQLDMSMIAHERKGNTSLSNIQQTVPSKGYKRV